VVGPPHWHRRRAGCEISTVRGLWAYLGVERAALSASLAASCTPAGQPFHKLSLYPGDDRVLHRAALSGASEAVTHDMSHNASMLTNVATIGGLAGVIASVTLLAWQTRAVAQQANF